MTRFLIVAIITTGAIFSDESASDMIRKGNAAFAEKKVDQALDYYSRAELKDSTAAEAIFNKAVVHAKKGELAKAKEEFEKVLTMAESPELKAKARFNLGNCALKAIDQPATVDDQKSKQPDPITELEKKLDRYKGVDRQFKRALRDDPSFADAAHNLELTRRTIRDVQKQIEKLKEERKKQEEEQKKQQQQLKDAVDKQKKLNEDTKAEEKKKETKNPEQRKKDAEDLSKRQQDLAKETEELRKQRQQQQKQQEPKPGEDPKDQQQQKTDEHLKSAKQEQDKAAEQLKNQDLEGAKESQKKATEELQKALESQKKEQPKQDEQGKQEPKQDEKGEKGEKKPEEQKKEQPEDQQPQGQSDQPEKPEPQRQDATMEEATSIIQDEKEKRKARRMNIIRQRPVRKDW